MMIEALHHDQPVDELEWEAPTDLVGIRNLMVMIAKAERQRDQKQDLLAEITHLYRVEIDRLEERVRRMRDHVKVALMTVTDDGRARFPDVGTAYLRTVADKIEVEDKQAFEAFAREMGCVRTVEQVDSALAKKKALEEIRRSGVVVPGARFVPEHQDVSIR